MISLTDAVGGWFFDIPHPGNGAGVIDLLVKPAPGPSMPPQRETRPVFGSCRGMMEPWVEDDAHLQDFEDI